MLNLISLTLKRLNISGHHSGAGGNISLWKLIRQGLPYYFNRQGYALPPFTIFITINGRCNLHCRMCDIGQKNKYSMFYKNLSGEGIQDFPITRFKRLIDEVYFFKPYIGVTTTEPLLYPHMFDAIEYARFKGLTMNISTNGVLIEKYIKEIIDSGLHRLSVSLDGPRLIHDRMRGVVGTYDKVVKGMRLLIEEKKRRGLKTPHIYITSYICDTNYSHMLDFLESLSLEGIERVNIKHMVFFTKGMVNAHERVFGDKHDVTLSCLPKDFFPENLDIDVLYEQVKEIKQRFGDICTLHFAPDKRKLEKYYYHPEEFMDSTRCVLPWFIAQITTKGDIIPLTRCYGTSYGNIMDRPFLEVWNGSEFRAFRRDLQRFGRFPACARCDGVLYC